jgi:ADP-heptose:LPS heptosyltransferase
MKKALLVRFGGLGDLLVALPSIRLIRGKYPDARLTLACREEYGALLRETGVVDEIVAEDSRLLTPLFSESPETNTAISDWLGSFDLIMGWTHGQKENSLFRFIHADPRKSGPLNLFFFRKTAETLGESSALSIDEWARLPIGRLQRAEALKRTVVIHPGSGSESKRWPLSNFMQIIARLGERSIAGALVTGEAEERMEAGLENTALPPDWTWLRSPSISTLAVLLSEAGLYLGNDSGVTHLAAACGADVVALFRQEFASAWRPLGRVHLHIAASLCEIGLESVWKTVASRLPNFSADSQNC